MIQEEYVKFETAKLLNEKGFKEPCKAWYGEYKSLYGSGTHVVIEFDDENRFEQNYRYLFGAPTQALAMKWLREEKHYYIQIMLDSWALGGHSGYYIVIQDINSDFEEVSPAVNDNDDVFFKTYEEAAEAAIKYVLEKLV